MCVCGLAPDVGALISSLFCPPARVAVTRCGGGKASIPCATRHCRSSLVSRGALLSARGSWDLLGVAETAKIYPNAPTTPSLGALLCARLVAGAGNAMYLGAAQVNVQQNAVQCNAMQCSVQCSAMQRNATQRNAT